MIRKFVLASLTAASVVAAALGAASTASANPWGYGPPPWARAWGWHQHHHFGGRPPAFVGRPVAPPHAFVNPHGSPQAYAPGLGHGYGAR